LNKKTKETENINETEKQRNPRGERDGQKKEM
jgi:hypothetical protein